MSRNGRWPRLLPSVQGALVEGIPACGGPDVALAHGAVVGAIPASGGPLVQGALVPCCGGGLAVEAPVGRDAAVGWFKV
jgi:hypothetical protein